MFIRVHTGREVSILSSGNVSVSATKVRATLSVFLSVGLSINHAIKLFKCIARFIIGTE